MFTWKCTLRKAQRLTLPKTTISLETFYSSQCNFALKPTLGSNTISGY